MNFSQLALNCHLQKAITQCGYKTPTPIQQKAIPPILEGKDLVASAQTGTGKTAAFVLPALHILNNQAVSKKVQVLILTPTRELADQISKSVRSYGKYLKLSCACIVGGMPYSKQLRDLQYGPNVVIATPGRLLDHIKNKRIDLSHVQMLVLDEADRMIDMGFIDDVKAIAKLTPLNRQTLLFSATVDKNVTNVIKHLLKNPIFIILSEKIKSAPQIKQQLYKTKNREHKAHLLKYVLNENNIYKAIIFTATKIDADKLSGELRYQGFKTAPLHGDLKQKERNRTVEKLRKGDIQLLVATDVAARGIDIDDLTHVINYDLPRFSEDYVHRIGRTGRAGKSGIAISFVLPSEFKHLQRIERYIGKRLAFESPVADGFKHQIAQSPRNDRKPMHFKRPTNETYQKTKKRKRK